MVNRWGKNIKDISGIRIAAEEGFSWAHLPINILMEMNENQFDRFKKSVNNSDIGFDVFSLSLPAEVVITQKGFNTYMWTEYAKKVIARISALGCKAVRWTGGSAVKLPEEGDVTEAKEQIMQFLFLVRDYSGKYGIKLLVEPSCRKNADCLYTIEETSLLLDAIVKENVGISVNSEYLSENNLHPEYLKKYRDLMFLVEFRKYIGNKIENFETEKEHVLSILEILKLIDYSSWLLLPDNCGKTELDYYKSII